MSQTDITTWPTRPSASPRVLQVATARAPGLMEHLAVLLLICISGNPTFMMDVGDISLVATAYIFTILLLVYNRMTLAPRFVYILAGFMTILILQAIDFSFLPVVTILGFAIRLYIAYTCLCLVREFPLVYTNVMFYIGVLSLCIYIPDNVLGLCGMKVSGYLAPFAKEVGDEKHIHVFLYTFVRGAESVPYRNSAFFWEPGAFAGFLMLALIFLSIVRDRMTRRAYKWRLFILSICLLSTQSTMGYAVLPLAMLLHFWPRAGYVKPVGTKLMHGMLAVIAICGVAVLFWQLNFVEKKISSQLATVEMRGNGWEMTRFGSLMFDVEYIKRRPLIGWGLHDTTRFALNPETDLGKKHGNGMSDFIAKLGFAGLALLIVSVGIGMYRLTGRHGPKTAVILVMMIMILNGESFLTPSLFLGTMFLAMRGRRDLAGSVIPLPSRAGGGAIG